MATPAIPANLLFPGGVGLTHLRVYDSQAPDGLRGGSPHLHFACTECYYVQNGTGRVQTLSSSGFMEYRLEPGSVVWFSPGVIHRLINEKDLEIFVVMGNGGLPEAGDFVLTFPLETLRDAERYFAAAALSRHGEVFTSAEDAALARRDLAVSGFLALLQEFEERGPDALSDFYGVAAQLVHPRLAQWSQVWRRAPLRAAQMTGQQLDALERGDLSHLMEGRVEVLSPPVAPGRLGMCGVLGTYLPEGKTEVAK